MLFKGFTLRAAGIGSAQALRTSGNLEIPGSRCARPGMTAGMDLPSVSNDVSRHFSRNERIN
jgi:hypothetical protein